MPLVQTRGAASAQGFGEFAQATAVNYIEDVFSTFLYDGTGASQTITNGIDLSTKGGLVWVKSRAGASGTSDHILVDTVRGISSGIKTNTTDAASGSGGFTSFNANGFSFGSGFGIRNDASTTYASWTFRKQPKFFDVQTFTYPLSGSITVPHNLASTPGCVMVKVTDGVDGWYVYHRMANNGTNPSNYILQLNTTGAQINNFTSWITVGSSSITFPSGALNPGSNFVMYLFAHDAGGFGLTGTDNVITCGSFTTDGSGNANVTLGYEPQWVLIKCTSSAQGWYLTDTMRGMPVTPATNTPFLSPNTSSAEASWGSVYGVNATGFNTTGLLNSATYIYIAIRRGPMKVPTDATKVFSPIAASNSGDYVVNAGFPPDTVLATVRDFTSGYNHSFFDRLRGNSNYLASSSTNAESGVIVSPTAQIADFSRNQNGIFISSGTVFAYSTLLGITYAWHNFRRAPSFFDVVCYTGLRAINNTTPQVVSHNLGVAPELVIFKCRSAATISSTATNWATSTILGGVYSNAGYLNTNDSFGFSSNLNPADGGGVSSSSITIGYGAAETNATGNTYVAYLFATCAGVSKVFSYIGNGSSQTINCGFTGGARFVMIKRTDSTGAWYVWDSARGIVSGNDPYFSMNTTAVEVTSDDSIDTNSTGFVVNQLSATDINVSSATYIGLAIA